MAIAFARFSQWLFGTDPKQKPHRHRRRAPAASADFPSGLHDPEPVKLNFSNPHARRGRGRMHKRSQNEAVDREHDMVIVPSDGGACLSGSESDGSDWSIGWMEPHPPHFCTSDDAESSEDSFAVLVPCYRPVSGPGPRHANAESPEEFSASERDEFLQHWLSSLTADRPI